MGDKLTMPLTDEIAVLIAQCDMRSRISFVRQLWLRKADRHGRGPQANTRTHDALAKAYNKLRDEVGVTRRVTPHDLRRTTAVAMYQQTRDLRDVQALLGHRSLQSTVWYLDHDLVPLQRATLEVIKGGKPQPTKEKTA